MFVLGVNVKNKINQTEQVQRVMITFNQRYFKLKFA